MRRPPEASARTSKPSSRRSILRVDHGAGGWKAIPIRLINDGRLALDTRGFAAWLLARPDGWQIRSSALPRLLTSEVERVGRDKTRRFLRELESAGYLSRIRFRGANGRWVWQYSFRPDPDMADSSRATMDGLAGGGSAVDGSTVDGKPGDLHQILISSRSHSFAQRTTTTEPTGSNEPAINGRPSEIRFPEWLSGAQLASAHRLIARCPESDSQSVMEEFSAMLAQGVVRHPMGLLKTLVERASNGTFVPNRSLRAARRWKSIAHERQPHPTSTARPASDVAKQVLSGLQSKFSVDPS